MSDRPLKLILIDDDPVFRLGLNTALQQFPDLQVVAEAETEAIALQILDSTAGTNDAIDLVILELYLGNSQNNSSLSLHLCQQIKSQYPSLPILLLTSRPISSHLVAARRLNIDGYCPKGSSITIIVRAIRQIASGQTYWSNADIQLYQSFSNTPINSEKNSSSAPSKNLSVVNKIRQQIRQSGLQQIDATLAEIEDLLQNANLSSLDLAMLAGRRRELLASRWLVNKFLSIKESGNQSKSTNNLQVSEAVEKNSANAPLIPVYEQETSALNFSSQETNFFEAVWQSLNSNLQNLTGLALEIDILRYPKKRELLYLCLRKFENLLDDLRFSQISSNQIAGKYPVILTDLWQEVTTDFFGKYYTVPLGKSEIDLVNILLRDAEFIQKSILDKVPFVVELLEYLLFEAPLIIDNTSYPYITLEAKARAEILLQNLLIQLANSVMQPLLNNFANLEIIKQSFYDQKLMSSRDIASFRNNLSWKYRLEQSINEPIDIFESRYKLFVLTNNGIKKIYIYASRYPELERLPPWQLTVTLLLETRDAIAPRLRSVITILGKSVVYLLTQVIGRGIGLIGRGILQGLGSAWQDNKYK